MHYPTQQQLSIFGVILLCDFKNSLIILFPAANSLLFLQTEED